MPILGLLLLAPVLASPVLGTGPGHPPPLPRVEPRAEPRTPVEERRAVELLAHGRALTPVFAHGMRRGGTALAAGLGLGFRVSPYFSIGGEGSTLSSRAPASRSRRSLELAAVARVYLLESGFVDPYLELALGYASGAPHRVGRTEVLGGPSARAGGGLDLVVASPVRLGVHLAYREVARPPATACSLECGTSLQGGLVAGLTVTLPLGQPL
jgi:hypothetical protein